MAVALTLAFAATWVVWGTSFLAIRVGVSSIPPLLMMGVRCVVAGALLLVWAAWRGERVTARSWAPAVIAGGLMFGVSYGTLAWAEQRMPSGMAALLVATLPFWFVVFNWRRDRPRGAAAAGLLLGLIGVAVLVVGDLWVGAAVLPIVAILAGEVAWAAGSLYGLPPRLPATIGLRAGMPMFAGGLLLLAASWIGGELETFDPRAVTAPSIAALVYLIVFASILTFSAYAWLLGVAPLSRVGTHAYVNPLIAVAVGSGVAGEPITASLVCGGAVIVVGVAMVMAFGGSR
jgi:drug/metabolite transporter (DMT)-like permease